MKEIKIIMTNPNDPPIVLHNDERIRGIVSLDYRYETSTDDSSGRHSFELEYFDKDSKSIRRALVKRTEDDCIYPTRLEGSE